jgi:predicted ATPase
MYSKGFAAEETEAAYARASNLLAANTSFSDRFAAAHGQWTLALIRSDFKSGRALASALLREAEDVGRVVEIGVARRGLALMCYFAGDFTQARTHCERALDACEHERDEQARERFVDDTGVVALACLAVTSWQLGEVERAREMIDAANRRAADLGHFPSIAFAFYFKSYLEVLHRDAAAALTVANALEVLSREQEIAYWQVVAALQIGWAKGRLHDPVEGAAELRRALSAYADQGASTGLPYFQGLLAELEVDTLGADQAMARIDEALALAYRTDYRCDLAFLHHLRGENLLKRNPADLALAEDAYEAAIAVAKQQGARSYNLLASLSLAKLYQSTGRSSDASTVLARALEGFTPTPEMPEIAEAQTLLERLAGSGEGAIPAKDPATKG